MSTNPSLPVFIRELISRNHKVSYLSYKDPNPAKAAIITGLVQSPFPITYSRSKTADLIPKSLLFVILAPVWLARHRRSFDVMFCDDALPVYSFLCWLLTRSRTVYRMGDYMTGYLNDSPSFVLRFLSRFFEAIEFRMLNCLDEVLAISRPMKDFLVNRGVRPDRIAVVTECVALPQTPSSERTDMIRKHLGVSDDNILLMFHGTIAPWKGVDLLIPALKILKETNRNVKLAIVGDGPLLSSLKDQANASGIRDDICFTGWVPFEHIPDYISACDVGIVLRRGTLANTFVLTTALMQYLSMSKPVVAPNLSTISEVIPANLRFNPDDAADLSMRLSVVVNDLAAANRSSLEASRVIRRQYTESIVADDLVRSVLTVDT